MKDLDAPNEKWQGPRRNTIVKVYSVTEERFDELQE